VSIEALSHDFGFRLVGNERPEEKAALESMLREAVAFVSEVLQGGQPRWLTICGKSGTGKTYLAKAISTFLRPRLPWLYEKIERPRRDPERTSYESSFAYAQEGPRFVKWSAVVDEMRDGSYAGFTFACRDFFKIIDDIGGESMEREGKPTVFSIGKLSRLADERLGKWTVITSNLGRAKINEMYDARIASRMMRDGNRIVDLKETVRDFGLRMEALQKHQSAA
jgi:hypothetical protein